MIYFATVTIYLFHRERNTGYDDSASQEVCLIPAQKTRRLVSRTLWDTLRTSVISGLAKKSKKMCLKKVIANEL